ncbi:hypothetical protein, partial [Actinophytocola sp.]|uniref:hypothetical protein n=1 Tax=Actinophytocola sp. TaxID=1872138 RepID=UPI002D8098B2
AASGLLRELCHTADPVLAGLAASTLASHHRQLGGHASARTLDAAALRSLSQVSGPGTREAAQAWSDALLGLAADAVGLGRFGEARRLAAAAQRRGDPGWRGAIRLGWVSAEIELGSGRAEHALPHAEAAAVRSADAGSTRHRVKSGLVLGAALAAAGDRTRARDLLAAARSDAAEHGLLPLVWPCALLLADLEPAGARAHRREAAEVLHTVLLRTDPVGRHIARSSPWVPDPAGLTG